MYFIAFKNLLPLTNIKNAEELGIKFDFLGAHSQRTNMEFVLNKKDEGTFDMS